MMNVVDATKKGKPCKNIRDWFNAKKKEFLVK